jgi:hypothetical protein
MSKQSVCVCVCVCVRARAGWIRSTISKQAAGSRRIQLLFSRGKQEEANNSPGRDNINGPGTCVPAHTTLSLTDGVLSESSMMRGWVGTTTIHIHTT